MKFADFRRLCLALPEAEEIETWGERTFRVRGRIFAMGAAEGTTVSLKASLDDQAGLVEMDPKTFAVAAYTGRFGWVNVKLHRLRRELGVRLIRNAWERTAPKRLVAGPVLRKAGASQAERGNGLGKKKGDPSGSPLPILRRPGALRRDRRTASG